MEAAALVCIRLLGQDAFRSWDPPGVSVQIHFQECDILCLILDPFGLEEKP